MLYSVILNPLERLIYQLQSSASLPHVLFQTLMGIFCPNTICWNIRIKVARYHHIRDESCMHWTLKYHQFTVSCNNHVHILHNTPESICQLYLFHLHNTPIKQARKNLRPIQLRAPCFFINHVLPCTLLQEIYARGRMNTHFLASTYDELALWSSGGRKTVAEQEKIYHG